MVLAVVDDLLFSSKIREAARAAGTTATFVRRRDEVVGAIRSGSPAFVVLDLDRAALDPLGVIAEIRALPELARTRLVGFVSHVHSDVIAAAKSAGCDRVMARSGFVAALPELMREAAVDRHEPGGNPAMTDVEAAAARLNGRVWRTPMLLSPWLSDLTGGEVWLKLETVQRTGSFKIRGALNALARLRERAPDVREATTASAGNHGVALATAGRELGIRVRVHLPATAPAVKKDALRRLGAELVEAPTYDAAEDRARDEVARGGVTFVSAYADTDVIAGAGTVGLEMLQDGPGLDTFLVPVGGGGLISGVALAVRARRPGAMILGAEAANSPVFTSALAAGRPVTVDVLPTVADGLAGNMDPASRTFGLVRDLVDRVVAVREDAIVAAMRELLTQERLYAEGAAATAVAAATAAGLTLSGRKVGIVVSGRNGGLKTSGSFFGKLHAEKGSRGL